MIKSDIILYVPVYWDFTALERCVGKAEKLGIKVMGIDGRFTDFPQINQSDYSQDGTKEMLLSRGHYYFTISPSREQEKMNYALEKAFEMNYTVFLYCGADAYYEGDMDEFLVNLQRESEKFVGNPTFLCVDTQELRPDDKWNNTSTIQPRIIINFWKAEARHIHWMFYEKGAGDREPLYPTETVISGITLFHDNTIRSQERDNLMTIYQDSNVARERSMYMEKVVKKARKFTRLLVWRLDTDGDYESAREYFLNSKAFSHIILCSDSKYATDSITEQFRKLLERKNNIIQDMDIVTAVYHSKTVVGNFTLDPDGKIKKDFTKYEKVAKLYSPDGLGRETEIIAAPYTFGGIISLNEKVVMNMEHMGDELDFLAIIGSLGFQGFAATEIRVAV